MKNADMIEGRGPMLIDCVFQNKENAINYINTKLGCMGRSPSYINHITGHVSKGWQDNIAWPYGGDWELKEIETKD